MAEGRFQNQQRKVLRAASGPGQHKVGCEVAEVEDKEGDNCCAQKQHPSVPQDAPAQ